MLVETVTSPKLCKDSAQIRPRTDQIANATTIGELGSMGGAITALRGAVEELRRWIASSSHFIDGVHVTYDSSRVSAAQIEAFAPLRTWIEQNSFDVKRIVVRDAYMFGPCRVGFLFLDVPDVKHDDGTVLPGAVMLRGRSAAALLWFKKEGCVHALMVRQPRLAAGVWTWEVPAGMADEETGDLRGRMFDEVREETGIVVALEDLVRLPDAPMSSPGLLDETYELFAYRIDPEGIPVWGAMRNKEPEADEGYGLRAEGEVISDVVAWSIDDPVARKDGKLLMLVQAARSAGVF